jgi:hypothetical protein
MKNLQKFLQVTIFAFSFVFFLSGTSFCSWPEFAISSDCYPGSAYGNQSSPSVARSQTSLLVVWEDERISTGKDIFCSRITSAGEILDLNGIPICTAYGPQARVKVAAGDLSFLAVWQDQRNGTYDVYGARIDLDGNVLDPDGFPISTGPPLAESPDAAWDGTNFLVVWSDDRSMISPDIYGIRIAPSGEIVDDSAILISSEADMEFASSVAFNGLNYLVAWEVGAG